jgi:hypothetical protein
VDPTISSLHRRNVAPALLAVLAATLVALTVPGTATATPCGTLVLDDWLDDGRIDRLYDLACYEDAVESMPEELRIYANAEEVIGRALQAASRGKLDAGGRDPTPDQGDPGASPPGAPPDDPTPPGEGPMAAADVDTTNLTAVPLPLIVLAAMSLVLLAAGGLAALRRRRAANELDAPDDHLAV